KPPHPWQGAAAIRFRTHRRRPRAVQSSTSPPRLSQAARHRLDRGDKHRPLRRHRPSPLAGAADGRPAVRGAGLPAMGIDPAQEAADICFDMMFGDSGSARPHRTKTPAETLSGPPDKRRRRTKAQVVQLDAQIIEVLAEDHPQSCRHVYYRMTDPRLPE